MNNSHY